MFGLTVGELALWSIGILFLIALVFHPKPLKQLAQEGWAQSMANLKWAVSIFYVLGGVMALILLALAYFTYFQK